MSRALVALVERGIQAELDAQPNLQATYQRFMKEREPVKKEAAGQDLIRAVLGTEAIAKDPVF